MEGILQFLVLSLPPKNPVSVHVLCTVGTYSTVLTYVKVHTVLYCTVSYQEIVRYYRELRFLCMYSTRTGTSTVPVPLYSTEYRYVPVPIEGTLQYCTGTYVSTFNYRITATVKMY